MQGAVASTAKPAKTGRCPCKGCGHNLNDCHRDDYTHHDTEIACKAKQRRGSNMAVTVNPVKIAKEGCPYRL